MEIKEECYAGLSSRHIRKSGEAPNFGQSLRPFVRFIKEMFRGMCNVILILSMALGSFFLTYNLSMAVRQHKNIGSSFLIFWIAFRMSHAAN